MINIPTENTYPIHSDHAYSITFSIIFKISDGTYEKQWLGKNIRQLEKVCSLYPDNEDLRSHQALFERCLDLSEKEDFSDIALRQQKNLEFQCIRKEEIDAAKSQGQKVMTYVVSGLALMILAGAAIYQKV